VECAIGEFYVISSSCFSSRNGFTLSLLCFCRPDCNEAKLVPVLTCAGCDCSTIALCPNHGGKKWGFSVCLCVCVRARACVSCLRGLGGGQGRAKYLHSMRGLLNIVSSEIISMTRKANDEIWLGRNWHLKDPRKLTWGSHKWRHCLSLPLTSGVSFTLMSFHKARQSTRFIM